MPSGILLKKEHLVGDIQRPVEIAGGRRAICEIFWGISVKGPIFPAIADFMLTVVAISRTFWEILKKVRKVKKVENALIRC